MKTNTSATMKFMSPSLDEHCNAIVISHPPVTFGVDVKNGEHSLPGFPIVNNSHVCVYIFIV